MKFVDTNIFIANFFSDETHHEAAKKIIQKLEKEGGLYIDYVLNEVLAWVRSKKGARTSVYVMDSLIGSKLKLIKVEERHIAVATELFRKYQNLSFTDCAIVAVLIDKNIKEIYSFDSDFDRVPGVIRLTE